MKKLAVLFSGEGTNLTYILEHLHRKEAEVCVALTNNPDAKGIQIVKNYGIPLEIIDSKAYDSRESFDIELVKRLWQYSPDLTVLAGFMRILTPIFTEQFSTINLHPSLLPRHKGLNAIEKSYEDEHAEGGVSVHVVTSELDGGEIIVQKKIDKTELDFATYYAKVRELEKKALSEAIVKVLQ